MYEIRWFVFLWFLPFQNRLRVQERPLRCPRGRSFFDYSRNVPGVRSDSNDTTEFVALSALSYLRSSPFLSGIMPVSILTALFDRDSPPEAVCCTNPVKAQSFMATGNVRQGRSTNRPEHYGNFGCRQDLHENSRLGNIPVNSRVCRKSHVFAFSVLSHVRFFRHFHKACHIRRICRIVSQTISGDPSCAANMFPLLFGRQETACSSATSVRPVPRPIN